MRDDIAAEGYADVGSSTRTSRPDRPVPGSRTVPAGALRLGVLGRRRLDRAAGDFAGTCVTADRPPMTWAEAVLRPPGWETDVVLERAHRGGRRGSPERGRNGPRMLGLVVEPTPPTDDDGDRGRGRRGGAAEVAVVVVGLTEEQETEAVDKATLALPGRQDELVSAVAAVAARTVVVERGHAGADAVARRGGGRPVGRAPGPGGWSRGRGGTAQRDRAGRTSGHDVPDRRRGDSRVGGGPTDGALPYDEGTYIGYRGHAAGLAPEPAYWFGHGLGYGEWTYGAGHGRGPHGGRRDRATPRRSTRARSSRSTSTRSATGSPCAWSAGPAADVAAVGRPA